MANACYAYKETQQLQALSYVTASKSCNLIKLCSINSTVCCCGMHSSTVARRSTSCVFGRMKIVRGFWAFGSRTQTRYDYAYWRHMRGLCRHSFIYLLMHIYDVPYGAHTSRVAAGDELHRIVMDVARSLASAFPLRPAYMVVVLTYM